MENFPVLGSIMRWINWENFFFLGAVFCLGWLLGLATFFIILSIYFG